MCYSQSLTVMFLVNEDTQIVCVDNVDGQLVFYGVKIMKHQILYCFLTTSHLVTYVSIIDFAFFLLAYEYKVCVSTTYFNT